MNETITNLIKQKRVTKNEIKVLMSIDSLDGKCSHNDISNDTSLPLRSVVRAVKSLMDRRIIKRICKLSINSNELEWIENEPYVNLQKKKEDIKSNIDGFRRFILTYPKKHNIKHAMDIWNKINPSSELEDKIINSVERFKLSEEWTKDNGKWIPYPNNFLLKERWLDDIKIKDDWRSTKWLT